MKKTFICLLAGFALHSCKEKRNEDIVQEPSKDGSVETALSISHNDSFDILTTTHKVWVKGTLARTIVQQDTLPSLGMETAEAIDSSGDKHTTRGRKDYEFYITVK